MKEARQFLADKFVWVGASDCMQVRLQNLPYSHAFIWVYLCSSLQPGSWHWTYSGQPLNFTFWNPGKPGGDCADALVPPPPLPPRKYSRWNEVPCTNRLNVICQTATIAEPTESSELVPPPPPCDGHGCS